MPIRPNGDLEAIFGSPLSSQITRCSSAVVSCKSNTHARTARTGPDGIVYRRHGRSQRGVQGVLMQLPFSSHCIAFHFLSSTVLFCCTVHYCLFSFMIFFSSGYKFNKLNLNLNANQICWDGHSHDFLWKCVLFPQ